MQGALSLHGAQNWLQSNTFANNSAAEKGGAIMYTQQSLQTRYLTEGEKDILIVASF